MNITPNTFIIGAPKCGTTALVHYLNEHADCFFSMPKEPFFWSSDIPRSKHELRPRGLDEYLELFQDAKDSNLKIVGEGSTRYLRSKVAVPAILEFNPDAKIIAMLRNPLEVAPAFHMEQLYVAQESVRSFDEAWALQELRLEGLSRPPRDPSGWYTTYASVAKFGEQIQRLQKIVPESQLKVLFFDDFKQDTGAVYRDVLEFLELEDDGRVEFPRVNSAHAQAYPRLSAALLHPPEIFGKPIRALRKYLLTHEVPGVDFVKSKMNVKQERQIVLDTTFEDMISHFYDDVRHLESLTQRDLSDWIPSRVG